MSSLPLAIAANATAPLASPLLRFDRLADYTPRRLNVVWLENTLDCRTWTYYCDLKDAMAKLHTLCIPRHSLTCVDGRRGFTPQVVVAGPRYMANVAHPDETLGFDRAQYAHLPLAVVQNKMYAATAREIVGDASSKLRWAREAGAVVGFTWLALDHDFTQRSGVAHYRLPFGVDVALYGRHAATVPSAPPVATRSPLALVQPIDVGFTGASNHKYPLREAILALVRSLKNVSSYFGTWAQTSLHRSDNRSWKALERDDYVKQISQTKLWVSTTGPSHIVGTRYFEILASGTTLLLCNRAPPGVYDGLLEDGAARRATDARAARRRVPRLAFLGAAKSLTTCSVLRRRAGVHAVIFNDIDDLRAKIYRYLADEPARVRIVKAAAALVNRVHTWDARARFITRAVEHHVGLHDTRLPYYTPRLHGAAAAVAGATTGVPEPFVACVDARMNAQRFTEVPARRPLRRYTVATCAAACRVRGAGYFGTLCGGFCSGNGHRLARCFCARSAAGDAKFQLSFDPKRPRQRRDCATTCSLHDSRPCGGLDTMAVFAMAEAATSAAENASQSQLAAAPSSGRLSKRRGLKRRGGGAVAAGQAQ